MRRSILIFTTIYFIALPLFAQFGQNKVNYKTMDWFYIQTKHFDIYFYEGGETIAEFTAKIAEEALQGIQKDINYQLNNRVALIVYNSHNDFQENNVTDEYIGKGTGGFTEPFKNRVVFPFEGNYKKFQHVIAHELVHAVMRDMYYGGTVQNIISRGITLQLPLWFWEGTAEFLSQGWETNTDMFIRNAIITEWLPDINRLDGYLAYRGGQSVFRYISDTYGRQKIGEILNKVQSLGSLEAAIKNTLGINLEELNERWKKSIKKEFWPDIALKEDPDEFAKRLTDNKKERGFYNTSPALSPQGDKIAFISDRDIYLDVYLMSAQDGKMIKKIVESGKTTDFEELNLLYPSLTWAPDNIRVALSSKAAGYNIITIIDTETEKKTELPLRLAGIESVSWSRDGNKIAFIGYNETQSDIYVYDFTLNTVTNLTNDIFSESDIAWSPDGNTIVFSSDRGNFVDGTQTPEDFKMYRHNYKQIDLYSIQLDSKKVDRITSWELSNEKFPVFSNDGNEILFISDKNGMNNIYKYKISDSDSLESNSKINSPKPITNSISDIGQLSISYDGKKLVFSALYNLGYNIFLLSNPFDMEVIGDSLPYTKYMASLVEAKLSPGKSIVEEAEADTSKKIIGQAKQQLEMEQARIDSTSQRPSIFSGQYVSDKVDKEDSSKADYSRYVFGGSDIKIDSSRIRIREEMFSESLDEEGNYLVNRYKINFTPDIVYANAGYSTLYGLLGTTILSFSDVLGNHRLIGQTSLQIDIKNSDYGLAYYYLKERLDVGFQAFHTARFLYQNGFFGSELYRFRNFGLVGYASYPLDRFNRVDFGLSFMSVSAENLDNPFVAIDRNSFLIPSIGFVKDNTMWGYYSPIEGSRYFLNLFGDPGIIKSRQSFYSLTFDYRKYWRFWFDNGFVARISGGFSGGGNPQRFFVGGTENWINRNFATGGVPINNSSDFAFLSPVMPLRGYDYAEKLGTKYTLANLELRMPLIRYLLTGPLPLFFQNILGTAFIDAGSAWDNTSKLKLIGKNSDDKTVTNDLLIGTGVGFRLYFLFLWRLDIAWKYDFDKFSAPRYYLSIGLDF